MPREFRFETWSFIREINGTITNTMVVQASPNKWSKVYGASSKVRLLPAPVGADTKNSFPDRYASIVSFGSHEIRNSPWPLACVAGGILWVRDWSFRGGAVFQKKRVGTRKVKYFSRLRRQISLDYITTVLAPNLTRLLHNTASYAGWWPQEHLSSLSQSTFNALSTCEWQLYPQGSLGATLIGPSALTCFWVGKIGANQVWKVLRPAPYEIRRRTFLKVLA